MNVSISFLSAYSAYVTGVCYAHIRRVQNMSVLITTNGVWIQGHTLRPAVMQVGHPEGSVLFQVLVASSSDCPQQKSHLPLFSLLALCLLPQKTSQLNYLHRNLCQALIAWGSQTKTLTLDEY